MDTIPTASRQLLGAGFRPKTTPTEKVEFFFKDRYHLSQRYFEATIIFLFPSFYRHFFNEIDAMPTITFIKEKKTVEVPEGANLRKEALKAGVDVYPSPFKVFNCHGLGQCTKCSMHIKKGSENVSKQSWFEKLSIFKDPLALFARLGHEKEMRLACRTKVYGDVEVETTPGFNWHGEKFWG